MKQITTFSGQKYLVTEEEVQKIYQIIGQTKFIKLKGGYLINASSIESIGDVRTKPFFMNCPMNPSMTKVFIQGEWKAFAGDRNKIEHRAEGFENSEDIKTENERLSGGEFKQISSKLNNK